jgi:hypothetical protein
MNATRRGRSLPHRRPPRFARSHRRPRSSGRATRLTLASTRKQRRGSAGADCCLAEAATGGPLLLAVAERRSSCTPVAVGGSPCSITPASELPGGSSSVRLATRASLLAQTRSEDRGRCGSLHGPPLAPAGPQETIPPCPSISGRHSKGQDPNGDDVEDGSSRVLPNRLITFLSYRGSPRRSSRSR